VIDGNLSIKSTLDLAKGSFTWLGALTFEEWQIFIIIHISLSMYNYASRPIMKQLLHDYLVCSEKQDGCKGHENTNDPRKW